jgi:flotillin
MHPNRNRPSNDEDQAFTTAMLAHGKLAVAGVAGIVGLACLAHISSRIQSVAAHQFIAKTGLFVRGVTVGRIVVRLPFQRTAIYSMQPQSFSFQASDVQTKELLPFILPLKFNIAPMHPEKNLPGFINYVTRVGSMTQEEQYNLISNIVIGKTREFTSTLSIHEILENKELFKKGVVSHIEKELEENGFYASSANISDIHDPPGVKYLENLSRKAMSSANTSSSLAVAEAEMTRIVGEKERETQTRQQQATLEAKAAEVESEQQQLVSAYARQLQVTRITNQKEQDLATVDAHRKVQESKIETEAELNKRRQSEELEKQRSDKVVQAIALAEAVLKKAENDAAAIRIKADAKFYEQQKVADGKKVEAEALLFTQQRQAEADLFQNQKQAEATKAAAEADLFREQREAEALLFSEERRASGIIVVAEATLAAKKHEAAGTRDILDAQAEGLKKLYLAGLENPQLASLELLTKEGKIFSPGGLFDQVGKHQADAIKGLEPKIHIWHTGNGSAGDGKTLVSDIISNLARTTPPLLDAIQQQTGIKLPPHWLPADMTPTPPISTAKAAGVS